MRVVVALGFIALLGSAHARGPSARPKLSTKGLRAVRPLPSSHVGKLVTFLARELPGAHADAGSIQVFNKRSDGSRPINISTREVNHGVPMQIINIQKLDKHGRLALDRQGRESSITFRLTMHRLDTDSNFRFRFGLNTMINAQRRFEMGD